MGVLRYYWQPSTSCFSLLLELLLLESCVYCSFTLVCELGSAPGRDLIRDHLGQAVSCNFNHGKSFFLYNLFPVSQLFC